MALSNNPMPCTSDNDSNLKNTVGHLAIILLFTFIFNLYIQFMVTLPLQYCIIMSYLEPDNLK